MSTTTPRTRLTPVYLTTAERHLVRGALDVLVNEIRAGASPGEHGESAAFARDHTIAAIEETAALFHDKATPEGQT